MPNQKQEKAFSFSSSSLLAPQPPVQSVRNLSTEPRAARSSSWPTRSARLPTQPPHLSCPRHQAHTTPGGNPRKFGLSAVVHQMCCVTMHYGNSDILHPCWVPDLVEAGGKDSLASVCLLETKSMMRFRKRLSIPTEKRHFAVRLTGTDTAIAINLQVPGWKLIMGWSHRLASLSPVEDRAVIGHVPQPRWEGTASPSSWASGTDSGQRQDASRGGRGVTHPPGS